MYRLPSQRLSVTWRLVVPAVLFVVAAAQFTLILAKYNDVRLPVGFDISWKPGSQVDIPSPGYEDVQAQLTGIPTAFSDPSADNYRWYTEAKLRQLTACMTRGDCAPNAGKVS